MAKEYTYTNTKSGKIIFRSVEENYVSKEDVDKKVLKETGQDPRLTKHIIDCTIRTLDAVIPPKRGRYDKNKRMQ
jgi:hypothetical protein